MTIVNYKTKNFLTKGVGWIGPGPEIFGEAVALGVCMDVANNGQKLLVGCDDHAFERILKKATGSVIGFIDAFGISIEEVGE